MNSSQGKSIEYTGDIYLKASSRSHLFITAIEGDLTIEFGGGGGLIPLKEGGHYSPYGRCTGSVHIIGGTFVVHEE